MEILRIKLKIDRKPLKCLASHIAYLQSLRSYSFHAEKEWFKYICHKRKIVTVNDMNQDVDRDGIKYITDVPEITGVPSNPNVRTGNSSPMSIS